MGLAPIASETLYRNVLIGIQDEKLHVFYRIPCYWLAEHFLRSIHYKSSSGIYLIIWSNQKQNKTRRNLTRNGLQWMKPHTKV
jgi:hypothetical protein